jgi:cytoskeletal protein CcmA (bactofilin family)
MPIRQRRLRRASEAWDENTGSVGMMLKRRHPDGDGGAMGPSEAPITDALGGQMTVVGRDTGVEGTLESDESIRIDGRAKGRITARGDVILSSNSDVEADIRAQSVVMGGTLKGTITARAKTEVTRGGRLQGRVRSTVLIVREGAVFSGESNVGSEASDAAGFAEDELQTAYDDATRQAAEWYRSRLGPEPDGTSPDRRDQPIDTEAEGGRLAKRVHGVVDASFR